MALGHRQPTPARSSGPNPRIAVASNTPFSEGRQTFTAPGLGNTIADRLTFNAILETGTDSHRLRTTTSPPHLLTPPSATTARRTQPPART